VKHELHSLLLLSPVILNVSQPQSSGVLLRWVMSVPSIVPQLQGNLRTALEWDGAAGWVRLPPAAVAAAPAAAHGNSDVAGGVAATAVQPPARTQKGSRQPAAPQPYQVLPVGLSGCAAAFDQTQLVSCFPTQHS
jgi:hypothetical protein